MEFTSFSPISDFFFLDKTKNRKRKKVIVLMEEKLQTLDRGETIQKVT